MIDESSTFVDQRGVANSSVLATLLGQNLGVPVIVPEHPSIIGALGAALHAETV